MGSEVGSEECRDKRYEEELALWRRLKSFFEHQPGNHVCVTPVIDISVCKETSKEAEALSQRVLYYVQLRCHHFIDMLG